MNLDFKKFLYIFIFFFFNYFKSYNISLKKIQKNECFNNHQDSEKKIEFNKITVKTNDSRKWYKNILSIYEHFAITKTIDKKI